MEVKEYVTRMGNEEAMVETTTRTIVLDRGNLRLEKISRTVGDAEPDGYHYVLDRKEEHFHLERIRLSEVDMAHLRILLELERGAK